MKLKIFTILFVGIFLILTFITAEGIETKSIDTINDKPDLVVSSISYLWKVGPKDVAITIRVQNIGTLTDITSITCRVWFEGFEDEVLEDVEESLEREAIEQEATDTVIDIMAEDMMGTAEAPTAPTEDEVVESEETKETISEETTTDE